MQGQSSVQINNQPVSSKTDSSKSKAVISDDLRSFPGAHASNSDV